MAPAAVIPRAGQVAGMERTITRAAAPTAPNPEVSRSRAIL